jgi:hypothetical protein
MTFSHAAAAFLEVLRQQASTQEASIQKAVDNGPAAGDPQPLPQPATETP